MRGARKSQDREDDARAKDDKPDDGGRKRTNRRDDERDRDRRDNRK